MQATRTGSGELDEVAYRSRAPLLGEADERDEDLRRRERVGERPMARLDGDPEEVGKARERHAFSPAREKSPREPDRVEDGCRTAPARRSFELAVQERHVEAGVVRDERRVACEAEEPPERHVGTRGAEELRLPDPGQRSDLRRKQGPRVDERLEGVRDLERSYAHCAYLTRPAGAGGETRGLQIEDDELGELERSIRVGVSGEADARAEPGQTRVIGDDVREQRTGDRGWRALEREENAGRLVGPDRPVLGLDELHEAIGGVERELHESSVYERTFVYNR